jgi:ankyrin repeat protein
MPSLYTSQTSLLHTAAANGDADTCCELIKNGTFANIKDEKRRTPLHDAAMNGHRAVCELL